ncbi:MAG: caspase family protein [Bacteroidota bacterium]|nr:caspase family protein [Bacteroidota bacterium]
MRVSALLVFFAAALLLPLNSQAQRVAWVVGNSDYADGSLPNPVNDAKLVSDSLEALGFQVQLDLKYLTYLTSYNFQP